MTGNKVELRTAYTWTCEDCGRDSFAQALVAEFSEEERQDLCQEHGVEAWETGQWVTRPDEVTCQHCGKTFETTDPYTEEDD